MNLITGVPYLSDNHLKGFDNYKVNVAFNILNTNYI